MAFSAQGKKLLGHCKKCNVLSRMWSAIGISAYFYVSDAVRFAQGFFVSEIWGQPISSYLFLYYCFYHLRFSERRRVMKTKSNIKKTWLGTLFVVVLVAAAMSVTVFAGDAEAAEHTSKMYATAWSLVPPLVAIILALITKEVYSSLFIGVFTGKRSEAFRICSSLTAAAVISLKVSIHEYPTPSLNCSFCLHATLSGSISAKASRTIRFSISFLGHILAFGFNAIATSRNSLSRNGTRPSTPQADKLLLARRQSYICSFDNLRTVSSWKSFGVGAL